jgi:hypothetical protein
VFSKYWMAPLNVPSKASDKPSPFKSQNARERPGPVIFTVESGFEAPVFSVKTGGVLETLR